MLRKHQLMMVHTRVSVIHWTSSLPVMSAPIANA